MHSFKSFLAEAVEIPGEGGRKKSIVRPSKTSIDPAAKISDLTYEFAAFPSDEDIYKVSDEEIIKRFEPYRERLKTVDPDWAKQLDAIESGHPLMSGEAWGSNKTKELSKEIRGIITLERDRLEYPRLPIKNSSQYGSMSFLGLPAKFKSSKELDELIDQPKTISMLYARTNPLDPRPVPFEYRKTHEYRSMTSDKYKKIAQRGADVAGKIGGLLDPISTAAEVAASKILPAAGMVASMYGLADTLFGKEATAQNLMMEPERKEQEKRDELLSSAMNPQNYPVSDKAPVELKRYEWRKNNK